MKQIITILFLLLSHQVLAQTAFNRNDQLTNNRTQIINGIVHSDFTTLFHPNKIDGIITDPKEKFVSGAVVSLKQKDIAILTTTTDSLGRYSFQPQRPGIYDLRVSYNWLQDVEICDIYIDGSGDLAVNGNIQMPYLYRTTVYDFGCPSTTISDLNSGLLSAEQLERLPTRDLTYIISATGIGTTIH